MQTCREEELGCSDRSGAASDPRCSSHLRNRGDGCGGLACSVPKEQSTYVPWGYDPDGAADWIFEVEKIFQAMDFPLVEKVTLAAFMLSGDAGFWW
ncbi:hypothetical protein CR513_27291, partial [Mucuna pruriens]